ncbi:MAG TPA: ribonuclease HI family protein [Dehalococcoidia bacterium]|nr:ribonuclease HI family protein [Dehalococcoidia bacterium]
MAENEYWQAYADGASRGNPGPAAIGVAIFDPQGKQVTAVSRFIGRATNNVAEYQSAITALETAAGLGATRLRLLMDSELVVRQVEGKYRVRNANLQPLWNKLMELKSRFERFEAHSIPRESNRLADRLANQALGPKNS